MASERQRLELEDGITDDYGSQLNTTPADELSDLARSMEELRVIRILQRFIGPVIVPILTPLIRQIVTEQIELAKQGILVTRNPANGVTNSVSKRRLKLQFRNSVSLPVYTGRPIFGENEAAIEIALVDAFSEQIINTGIESTAKVQVVGFRVGDDGIDSWTFEEFLERVNSEKKGKRILQGDTCLQLKDGVCFVSKISFTHNSENTKNGCYRLGAGVVDAALMNRVEVAMTEAFLMKDVRTTYSEKRPHPRLSDKVCHLQQISYKGNRYRHLRDAGVMTVKDLLTHLYTDEKRLQNILKVKASSNIWNDIVNNAQASNGMFLYLDPSNQEKTGVVLNAKRQLKGLIAEPYEYVPVDHLSAKQKVENKELVKVASQHFHMLQSFEDETSLKEYLILCGNQNLGTSNMIDGPPRPSNGPSETPNSFNKSNSHVGQHMTQAPTVTSQYDRGKGILKHFDNEMTYSINSHPEDMSALESPAGLDSGPTTEQHAYYPTEPGTCFQGVESPMHTCEHMNSSGVFSQCVDCLINKPDFFERIIDFLNHDSLNSDSGFMTVATQAVSICTIERARTRWIKVAKLLRRNSVRERISLTEGIQSFKKQRCC